MISESETLISLKNLPRFLEKRDGRKPSIGTIYRWISKGLNGCKLEVVYRAGRPFSSEEALRRFDDAVTAARLGATHATTTSNKAASQAHERAKRRLAAPKRRPAR